MFNRGFIFSSQGSPAAFFNFTDNQATGVNSLLLNLPSSIPSGATVYIAACVGAASAISTVNMDTSGYTTRRNLPVNGNANSRMGLWTKIADGTESSVTVSTGGVNANVVVMAIIIQGGVGYFDDEPNSGSGATVDQLTNTFNSDESVSLVISYAKTGDQQSLPINNVISGYTLINDPYLENTNASVAVHAFYKESVPAGGVNPGTYDIFNSADWGTLNIEHEGLG